MLLTLLHLKPQTDSSFSSLRYRSLLREAESVPSPGRAWRVAGPGIDARGRGPRARARFAPDTRPRGNS